MTSSRRLRLGVGAKFVGAVTVLLLGVLAVAWVAALALARSEAQADMLFDDHLQSTERASDLSIALHDVELTAVLRTTATADERVRRDTELDAVQVPAVTAALRTVKALSADDEDELGQLDSIQTGLQQYAALRAEDAGTEQVSAVLDRVIALAEDLRAHEEQLAQENRVAAHHQHGLARLRLGAAVGGTLLLGLVVAVALVRDQVPRITRYATFARDVAARQHPAPLRVRGTDELAVLGRALDELVVQDERRSAADRRQTEFVDTLQVTSSEEEAHDLLQHHLDRSLPDSSARVLQRNNSANRLQPATCAGPDDLLAGRLAGAEPRNCLAVRFARTHREGPGLAPLLPCRLCGVDDAASTCEPLLVGGEVIGSVLITHGQPLEPQHEACLRTSVGQAAPVLANLRNLALAEFRANSDSLTGLPNRRATDDTLKRMVAQANRSLTPLVAVMLDLDHFKQINDRFGHGRGDEVLAAVGATLRAGLRASDFAGRYGGEEFLLLLPDTGLEGAAVVAENLRAAIALISVPGVERDITASLGLADLLVHAGNATGLVHAADQALYAAKAAGRNRVLLAPAPTPVEPAGESATVRPR